MIGLCWVAHVSTAMFDVSIFCFDNQITLVILINPNLFPSIVLSLLLIFDFPSPRPPSQFSDSQCGRNHSGLRQRQTFPRVGFRRQTTQRGRQSRVFPQRSSDESLLRTRRGNPIGLRQFVTKRSTVRTDQLLPRDQSRGQIRFRICHNHRRTRQELFRVTHHYGRHHHRHGGNRGSHCQGVSITDEHYHRR